MKKTKKSLGLQISIFSSSLALTLAVIATVSTSLMFAADTREATFTLVESCVITSVDSVKDEVGNLENMTKIFDAHGTPESDAQMDEWWSKAARSEYDTAAVLQGGQCVWKSEGYFLPDDFNLPNGVHRIGDRLVVTYTAAMSDDGATMIVCSDMCNNSFVDEIKEETECDTTLFLGDVRYNTTLLNDKGERNIGTTMDPKVWETIQKGEDFEQLIKISGTQYFVHYKPLTDNTGEIIGAYFGGYSAANYNKNLARTNTINTTIVIVIAIGIVGLLIFTCKNLITRPINALLPVCDDIKNINLTNPNTDHKFDNDEIGTLAHNLMNSKTQLNEYIRDIVRVLESMAQGDFSQQPALDYAGDFKAIENAFNTIRGNLGNIIANVNTSADNVASGAAQMASGTQMLSEGTQRQATAVEELSSTINDISDKVNTTADNAQKASDLSTECADIMNLQTERMSDLMDAMDVVEKKSEDIANIIKAIEDISFQTNILALNAAIEAARAGDVGKGFAVVATEVGTLAAKSAESANSTKQIIDNTLKAVSESTRIAHEAADALRSVTEKSKEYASLVSEIAEASAAQAHALEQATAGINDIGSVIQMNSATAEQSAASCEELSSQAAILQSQIEELKA